MPSPSPIRLAKALLVRPAMVALGVPPWYGAGAAMPPLTPEHRSRRWGFAHVNVVVPDLPAPHQLLACAVFVGQPGARAFDVDHALAGSPKATATVGIGTAATAPGTFAAFSVDEDCDLDPGGAHLRFGDLLTLAAEPDGAVRLRTTQPGFAADLRLEPSAHPRWFARSPAYQHVGVAAPYAGTVTTGGRTTPVEGLASLEHARGVTAHLLRDRRLPGALKLPVDRFAYHVLDPGDGTLLLLTSAEALGTPLLRSAHVTAPDRPARTLAGAPTLTAGAGTREAVAPDGRTTTVPERMTWRVGDELRIELRRDTGLIYGIGRGWMGGATFTGTLAGRPVEGRAYLEHIDVR